MESDSGIKYRSHLKGEEAPISNGKKEVGLDAPILRQAQDRLYGGSTEFAN